MEIISIFWKSSIEEVLVLREFTKYFFLVLTSTLSNDIFIKVLYI